MCSSHRDRVSARFCAFKVLCRTSGVPAARIRPMLEEALRLIINLGEVEPSNEVLATAAVGAIAAVAEGAQLRVTGSPTMASTPEQLAEHFDQLVKQLLCHASCEWSAGH